MIEVKEETIESTLRKVIQDLLPSESRLVSFTKRINYIDPLHFFEAGTNLHMNRSFWKSTLDKFTLVGIGTAYAIQANHSHQLKEKWDALVQKAIMNNPYHVPGTGITAIGGMDFDPLKPRTVLWDNFATNELRIPTFLLMEKEESVYLTITVCVNGADNPEAIAKQLAEQERFLTSYREDGLCKPSLVSKEEVNRTKWKETVRKGTEFISSGHANKVVLARELKLEFKEPVQVTKVIQDLIVSQPTSYIFAFEKAGDCFVGATPERLVKVEKDALLSTCLAGTAPRGKTDEEDQAIGEQLLFDPKNREEHDFVVQMIKKSLQEFCKEMQVPDKPVLYKLKNLQHLYTPVKGIFKEGNSVFDVIEKLHPTPALGGEPREAALQFIREHEVLDRGWYGAPIGWVDSNQNGEFAVAIRSGLLKGDKASLFAGCGVVKESDPEAELEETSIKFLPMLNVLGG